MNRLRILTGIFSVLAAALSSCGSSGFTCDYKSNCANDNPQTASDKMMCQTALSDTKCGDKYKDQNQCYLDKQKCDSMGKTDVSATLAACATESQAYNACSTTAM